MRPAVNQPPFNLATHQRQRIRALREQVLCPSCGKWAKYLEEHTGFCQTCTNEHRRGSGPRK